MSFTATITKFGIQSGTEDTLYVAWSWPPSSSKKSSGAGGSSSGSITYYKAPSYSGYSIVDALARAGEKDTSLPHRQKIAVLNGYVSKTSDWSGTNAQNYPAVPASTGDEALFQCTKPSGVPRGPSHLQFP